MTRPAIFTHDDEQDDFRNILKRIDASDILDHFAADNVTQQGDELIHSCLIDRVFPHHSNGDANPSAAMNMRTKAYNCFSFGGGSLFWFLEQMEGNLPAALESLNDLVKDIHNESSARTVEKLKELLLVKEEVVSIPRYSDRILRPWEGLIHPYLTLKRGLDPEVLSKYRVGWSEAENRIIMPHFFEGKLVGWQRRVVPYDPQKRWPKTEEDYDQKYKNSPSFPKHLTVFNLDNVQGESVIVTEGAFRVYKSEGFEGRPFEVVSTFSANVSKEQASLLAGIPKVYIMFDPDRAGLMGAYWALKRLQRRTSVWLMISENKEKDLADMTIDEVNLIQKNALPGPLAMAYLNKELGK